MVITPSSKRRAFTAVVVFAIGGLVLSGCGRSDSADEPQASAATIDDSPATGEITIWTTENESRAIQPLADAFIEDNPDVKINITPVTFPELPRKLDTAIASGAVPDIIQPSTGIVSFAAANALEPVPEGLFDWDDFFEAPVEAANIDGVQYGVPWYVTVQALYYRSDYAEAAGVKAPTTWEDAIPFAEGLRDAGATWGLWEANAATAAWQTIVPYIYQAGGTIYEDGEFTLDSPETVEALDYYQSFFREGLADPNTILNNPGEAEASLADGSFGSYTAGSYSYKLATEALGADSDLLGLAPLPAGPASGGGYLGGSALSVMADSDNKDAAWKFLRFFNTPEAQSQSFETVGALPALQAPWEDGPVAESAAAATFGEVLEQSKPLPKIVTWTEIRDQISTYAEQLARGVITPKDAAAALQAAAEKIGDGQ